jgi:hypothetical protein
MKKTSFKILSVILALLMALSIGTTAFAETDDSSDTENTRFSVINSTAISFTISGLTAECSSKLTAKYSTSLHIKMELQKKSNGSYSTVKTWTKSATGIGTTLDGSKVINPLSTYRLKSTFTAGGETHVMYKY